jgi:hypothetical protein
MKDEQVPITFEDIRRVLLGEDEYKRVTQAEEAAEKAEEEKK